MWREGEDRPMTHRTLGFFHRCEADLQHLVANGPAFPTQLSGFRTAPRYDSALELTSVHPDDSGSRHDPALVVRIGAGRLRRARTATLSHLPDVSSRRVETTSAARMRLNAYTESAGKPSPESRDNGRPSVRPASAVPERIAARPRALAKTPCDKRPGARGAHSQGRYRR